MLKYGPQSDCAEGCENSGRVVGNRDMSRSRTIRKAGDSSSPRIESWHSDHVGYVLADSGLSIESNYWCACEFDVRG